MDVPEGIGDIDTFDAHFRWVRGDPFQRRLQITVFDVGPETQTFYVQSLEDAERMANTLRELVPDTSKDLLIQIERQTRVDLSERL